MKNKNKVNKYVYVGIGIILGIFICEGSSIAFGGDTVHALTAFSVMALILAVTHLVGKSEKIPAGTTDEDGSEKTSKTLSLKKRIWPNE
jgi:hypothetical protein